MKKGVFLKYYRMISVVLVLVLSVSYVGVVDYVSDLKSLPSSASEIGSIDKTVVIDAGHGGEDGGTVGVSGTLEKNVNLSVSLYLKRLFELTDIRVVLTRNSDKLMYSEGEENHKKASDVRNRVKFTKQVENPVFVSIHQNSFPISKYSGLQVYYSENNTDSKALAEVIQSTNREFLRPDNYRKIKPAGNNIYVLRKLDCPAVLVECGFLSNEKEEQMLKNEDYQKKMSFVIFSSVVDYLTDGEEQDSESE